jgi:hypothetical protein
VKLPEDRPDRLGDRPIQDYNAFSQLGSAL